MSLSEQLRLWAFTASNFEFWLYMVLLLAAALGGLWLLQRSLRRARIIEDTPTSKIRSAAQGYVELDGWGELLPGAPIISPLSGTRCLWYRYKLEERERDNNNREQWRTLQSGTSDDLFQIKDDSGECVVDPEGAEIIPSVKRVWYGSSANPQANAPLARPTWARLISTERYRYREELIKPLDSLYIIGQFSSEGGSQEVPDLRGEVSRTLRDWKRDPQRLRQFDANGDGMIDQEEWQQVRHAAKQHASAQLRERITAPATHLMRRPGDARPFIISTISQETLSRHYRLRSLAGMAAFFLCGALLVWFVGMRGLG